MQSFSFDLWNTLIVSNPAFKGRQASLLADFFGTSVESLSAPLSYLDKALDKKAEQTGLQTNFAERIGLLAEALSLPLPTEPLAALYEAQERLFLAHLPSPSEAEVGKVLDALKAQGAKLFLVSNTGFIAGSTLRLMLAEWDMLECWDMLLFSDEIGFSKPDKRIFAPVLAYPEVVHIGDNFITDYQGARKLGLHSLLYTKNLRNFDPNLDTIHQIWDLLKFIA